MTRFLHHTGSSFTEFDATALGRGLNNTTDDKRYAPRELPAHLSSEVVTVLRQVISTLDKVLKKPRQLKHYHIDAYILRVRLASSLWRKLMSRFKEQRIHLNKADQDRLFELWRHRIYAFATKPVDEEKPGNDDNASFLLKIKGVAVNRDGEVIEPHDFHGRWYQKAWEVDGVLDHNRAADAIISHLFEQELTINGEARRIGRKRGPDIGKATGVGLMFNRGTAISKSADDPQQEKGASRPKPKIDLAPLIAIKDDENGETFSHPIAQTYFAKSDVVATISGSIAQDILDGGSEQFFGSWFGKKMSEHWGEAAADLPKVEGNKIALEAWALHNAVRGYYQKLAKSEKFRREVAFCRNGAGGDHGPQVTAKLKAILPMDAIQLLRRLGGQSSNADMSRFIRHGKIVAHASDRFSRLPGLDQGAPFEERAAYLATSEGQSYIKHVEAFSRSWRRATALSVRSLRATTNEGDGKDLTSKRVMVPAFINYNRDQFLSHLRLLFGDDKQAAGTGHSRADIFLSRSDKDQKQAFWGLLSLAAEVRNCTHHFNVRRAMLERMSRGFVYPTGPYENDTPKNGVVAPEVQDVFDAILQYDLDLRDRALWDFLVRVKADVFARESLKNLIPELRKTTRDPHLVLPRFRAVVQKARGILEGIKGDDDALLVFQSLPKPSEEKKDADLFRYEMFLQLYRTGFPEWLSDRMVDETYAAATIRAMRAANTQRRTEHSKAHKKQYRTPLSIIEDMGLQDAGSLKEILDKLVSASMTEQVSNRPYFDDKMGKQEASGRIEAFKQELVARMFADYIADLGFDWLGAPQLVAGEALEKADLQALIDECPATDYAFDEGWHGQIYAWFYLVPSADVALLQHQVRKNLVLEEKTHGKVEPEVHQMLTQLDQLMALYIEVQAAGFAGTEHHDEIDVKGIFYGGNERADTLLSGEYEDHKTTLAGTRAGLRQIARFAHLKPLKKIFASHPITNDEIDAFTKVHIEKADQSGENLTAQQTNIRKSIRAITDLDPRDRTAENIANLEPSCERYMDVAHRALGERHKVEAARLVDHLRLHRLMMQVTGRLTDYTLMWERDRLYAYLGMIYAAKGQNELSLSTENIDVRKQEEDGVVLNITDPQGDALKVKLLSQQSGFLELKSTDIDYLPDSCKAAYVKAFVQIVEENPKDLATWQKAKADNKSKRKDPWHGGRENPNAPVPRKDIRNHLAHHNVIDSPRQYGGCPNLTYVTNAVRSLMSYDRKLKNAVPKSIKKLLIEAGLRVDWRMSDERLTSPAVYPDVEVHLGFVRRNDGDIPVAFNLPRASVRFTSMAQALFDFGSSGYGLPKEKKVKSEWRYPPVFERVMRPERAKLNACTALNLVQK